jgi:hypothetical protein
MIRFGGVEFSSRDDLSKNLTLSSCLFSVPRFRSQPPLLLTVKEYDGYVLSRPGPLSRIVAIPEGFQQFFIRDPGRVVVNLNRLRVITKIVISRVLFCPPRISDTGANDTRGTPEPGVGSPESAQCKGCRFGLQGHGTVYGWDCNAWYRICLCHLHDLPLFLCSPLLTCMKEETKPYKKAYHPCGRNPLADIAGVLSTHPKPLP